MRSKFPSILTTAEVIPVFKKGASTEKESYRPVSILSNILKIYERFIFEQIVNYFEQLLSKYQCGFGKGFSAQHCLIAMIEKWRISADNGGYYGAVLTDLSKAFDCLPHGLIIAKLHAYGFEITSLKYLNSYLTERKQRVKLEHSFSDWKDIEYGVPQGSILGPLLFNIFISDIFICVDSFEIVSYADDNTPYSYKEKLEDVLISLEDSTNELFKWFANNSLKPNAEKCHLLTNSNKPVSVKIGESSIYNSNNQNPLGITLDSNLTFESHINQLCKKAGQKLSALPRLSPYMSFPQRRLLMNALFKSQFSYYPLILMSHSRGINNKINRLHERCRRVVYNDNSSTFQELLTKDFSVTVHERNIQSLAIELFKAKNRMSPEIINETFVSRTFNNNLRTDNGFESCNVKTVRLWNQISHLLST